MGATEGSSALLSESIELSTKKRYSILTLVVGCP